MTKKYYAHSYQIPFPCEKWVGPGHETTTPKNEILHTITQIMRAMFYAKSLEIAT